MEIIQVITLGVVQGLGEFLPISSTAHLVLVPFFTGWEDPGLTFDVALHVGTLFAVLAYFCKDWLDIFKLVFVKNFTSEKYNKNILWLLVIATIPGALAGYFLEDLASSAFRNPYVVAFTLAFFGLLLYLFDKYFSQGRRMDKINLKDAVLIGISQAIAIVPGVSRSGATITASRALGLDRVSSARFSFLMSTPIILGAASSQISEIAKNGGIGIGIIIGVITAAISGYLAIKYLIIFVQKSSYKIFFYYRLALATIIVLTLVLR